MKKNEPFKIFSQATSATLKVFSNDEELTAHFTETPIERKNAKAVDFPLLDAKHPDYFYIRYLTDKYALQKRWENPQISKAYQPYSAGGKNVFDSIKQTRLMAKAHKKHWRGIYNNFIYQYVKESHELGLADNPNKSMIGRKLGVSLALLDYMGYDIPNELKPQAALWLSEMKDKLPSPHKLKESLDDEALWLKNLQQALKAICPEEDDLTDSPSEETQKTIENKGAQQGNSEQNPADIKGEAGEENAEKDQEKSVDEAHENLGGAEDFNAEVASKEQGEGLSEKVKLGYRIYTSQYDSIAPASELASIAELKKLRQQLDEKTENMQNIINRLANKLQRHLTAQQKRFWQFDLEDGILDAARLARIVANPTLSLAYKQEIENPLRHTCVSLLIDNSGSMRGRPIALAAIVTEILARTLERCGVSVEILGFTTRHWRGGESKKHWEKQGMPKAPGRLNDLLHIIYKSAEQPYRRSKLSLALMLKDGLLKENIDGEALLWASQRLMQRPEQRKILMVLSDGAPVDDATLGANEPDILYRHLCDVVKKIENQGQIELMAFGIGHDVTDIYSHAITLSTVAELADTLFNEMIEKFTRPTGM